MDVDGETVVAWAQTWGVEAVLAALALAGLVVGSQSQGGTLALVLGVALLAATADRVRLRLDNQSLAAAVEEASEVRVSAARRETPADTDAGEPAVIESEATASERAAPDADG